MLVRTAYFDEKRRLCNRFDRVTNRSKLTTSLEDILPAGSQVVGVVIVGEPDVHIDAGADSMLRE